ncbi:hypothetical protein JK358_35875 [Nocardia sp. 2]|uniref:Uncharacterized protein n=1 Tax=Nocardia acididurans TaxID=2802282 RepID=A0ABS1MIC3_9NOCA|nr:hypothetical protein [Nocardia acididurans]MBL1079795.1 hypothetical protein [Nocardia acididurans]
MTSRHVRNFGIVAVLLAAPLIATATAAAVPLDQQTSIDSNEPIGDVCIQQWPASLLCILSSSAGTSSFVG